MRLALNAVKGVGGMRPLDGKSPFASASLVVREGCAPYQIARISRYEGEGHAIGEPLSSEEWQTLCDGWHGHAFADPVPIETGTRMWLLRQNFEGRGAALSELRAARVVVSAVHDGHTGTDVVLVRENDANSLRDGWAERAYARACDQAYADRWERALMSAVQAFVLGRGPVAKHWALLALCCERVGQTTRADDMVSVARRSYGAAFAEDVITLRKTLFRAHVDQYRQESRD